MSRIEKYLQKITGLLEDLEHLKNKKEKFFEEAKNNNEVLKGKSEDYWKKHYDTKLFELLDDIEDLNKQVAESFMETKSVDKEAVISTGEIGVMSKKEKKLLMKDMNMQDYELEMAFKKKEKVSAKQIKYSLYKTSGYGKLANRFVERLTLYLNSKYPNFFRMEHQALRKSDIKVLSKTYDSMVIFSSLLAFLGVMVLVLVFSLVTGVGVIPTLIRSVSFAFLAAVGVFGFVYYYPSMIIGSRNRAIKNDLPFVIIHMAAVAGSGAQPISMFNLVLSGGEYKGLESEIRKIVNYVNLFGYSLTSALRTVAATTPSRDFRELLTGIIATVETGGDLKRYLKSKSKDALNTYKLERKKYTDTLATYSDIYTGLFIAAPLLFLVTLAIINVIGGQLGSLDIKTLSMIGVFGVIPFMNVAYAIFLSMVQPET